MCWQEKHRMRDLLKPSWVGKKFKDYRHERIHTIVDLYTTTDSKGSIVNQTYVTEKMVLGQVVKGECPKAFIDRSVMVNGWLDDN